MEKRKVTRGATRLAGVVAAILALVVLAPVSAYADFQTPISGDTWSDATKWYISANYRTVSSPGVNSNNINVAMDQLPHLASGADDQLVWQVIGNSGAVWNGTHYIYNTTTIFYIASASTGAQFRNKYHRYTTCTSSGCNHHFVGYENY